ncbi:macrophage mannose receptor 1-like [Neodiprion fabricii]|uniref:macrophage mannose receptor 1-like n=1 Tax=Neodiprion fabricii TaxID=2872261 RepID=UPI001ED94924|nr:macrophage mannose receptor 1-like [Neodiprion fabricii]
MASALIFVVLGTVNFFGTMHNNQSSVVPGLNLTSTSILDQLISLRARRNNYINYCRYTSGIGAHKLHIETASWNSARHNCQDEGGHLAIINSVEEAQVISKLVDTANIETIWIGAHDLFNEDEFVTIENESIYKAGYSMWERGEPNNVGNKEHCLAIRKNGKLDDRNCKQAFSYVCEIRYPQVYVVSRNAENQEKLAEEKTETRCLRGSLLAGPVTRRDDYTYTSGIGGYKVHTRAVLWNEARITCEEEGGHLAILNSAAEANAVTQLCKKSPAITGSPLPQFAGIGFHDLYREGQYVTIHGQTLAKAGFTQWAPGQPDNIYDGKPENCGSLDKNGGLNDIGCDVPIGFVCELPAY